MNTLLSLTPLGRTALTCIDYAVKSNKIAARSVSEYLNEWKQHNRCIPRSFGASTLHIISSIKCKRTQCITEKSNRLALDILRDLQIASTTTFRESLAATQCIEKESAAYNAALSPLFDLLVFYQKRFNRSQVQHIKAVIRAITHSYKERISDIKEKVEAVGSLAGNIGCVSVMGHANVSQLSQPDSFCKRIQKKISQFEENNLQPIQRALFKNGEEAALLNMLRKTAKQNARECAVRVTLHFGYKAYPKTIALLPTRRLIFDMASSYEYKSLKEFKRSYLQKGATLYAVECFERAS